MKNNNQTGDAPCVSIDGEPAVCLACAERCANEGGFNILFWMVNKPRCCDGQIVCPECGEQMGGNKAVEAAVRLGKVFQQA
jgi:hypothetical protein